MLKARVVTALALVAGFLLVLFRLPAPGPFLAFVAVVVLAAWEWGGLMKAGAFGRAVFAAVVLASCLVLRLAPSEMRIALHSGACLFWLLVVPVWFRRGWTVAVPAGWLVGWWVVVPTWAALVELHARNPLLLLAVMALVWVADIGAYFAGRAFGRRKLAPTISPGKTWEGVAGGLAGVLIYGLAVGPTFAETAPLGMLPLAGILVLLAALSVVGDLFESLAKRQAGVKDSGQLLPGHGGVLDRIDSQTSTLPLVALGLHWMSR